jgi:hypothetical protein
MRKLIFAALSFTLLAGVFALAQYSTKPDETKQDNSQTAAQEKQERQDSSRAITVTGCLQKGDQPDEFSITGEDGKTWGLHSSTVKLAEHVGHQVTVTGSSSQETKAEEKKEKKEGQVEKASGKEEYGDLHVTNLKMVSTSCSK